MNNQFDELTKSMAQSVTRRAALKQLGVGLAGMALACFGLASRAGADNGCDKVCLDQCMAGCGQISSKTYCRKFCRPGCGC
jgi:hypothetical protein